MKAAKRLLKSIQPTYYRLDLDIDMAGFSYALDEELEFELLASTAQLELHCNGPKVEAATIDGQTVTAVRYDRAEETVILTAPGELAPGPHRLKLKISGVVSDSLHGLYRSSYQSEGQTQYWATTQFEATHARECFVCIDEPAAKATFTTSLSVPTGLTVVSNAPVTKTQGQAGRTRHQFEPTPIMSTYLVAFIVGEMAYTETTTKHGVTVRVYTTPDKRDDGRFALETAAQTLDFYTEYFGIPYPLAKLDMLAVPDFAAGAMENWGAVTYRESDLLISEGSSAQSNRERVAMVVTHELAHQWFGNLVTMAWWTDLWLNEGFASWIQYLASDHLFPEWKFWEKFVADDYSGARELDSLANTHPIEVEVRHPSEISEIFDAISYEKGASVIRMLHHYLGDQAFRGGLQAYLRRYQYTSATTADLWSELESYSKQPVSAVMSAWTKQPGYPIVSFADGAIKQKRFGDHSSPLLWPVPISAVTSQGEIKRTELFSTTKAATELKLTGWFKPNLDQTAFYITGYTAGQLEQLSPKIPQLNAIDRWGVLTDALALNRQGQLGAKPVLELLRAYRPDDNLIVWKAIAAGLGDYRLLAEGSDCQKPLEQFVIQLSDRLVNRLGWQAAPNEENYQTLLRPIILMLAGMAGDRDVWHEALTQFGGYMANGNLDPNLRQTVYRLSGKFGDAATQTQLWQLYRDSDQQEEKRRLFYGLASASDKAAIDKVLAATLSPDVRSQDSIIYLAYTLFNDEAKQQSWDFIKEHWAELKQRYGGAGHMLSRLPTYLSMVFASSEVADEIESFLAANGTPEMSRSIKQGVERIRIQADWRKRDLEAIASFLTTHPPT